MRKCVQTWVTFVAVGVLPAGSVLADSLTFDTTEPTANLVAFTKHSNGSPTAPDSVGARDTFTTVFPQDANNINRGDRGQTFTTPDNPTGTTWGLSTITIRSERAADFTATTHTMKLSIAEWNPSNDANDDSQFGLGDGSDDQDDFDGTGATVLLNRGAFDITHNFTAGEFMHFNLSTSNLHLKENTAYAFVIAIDASDATGFRLDDVRDLDGATNGEPYALGGIVRVNGGATPVQDVGSNGDDLVFYVEATPTPEPASATLFGLGSLAMLAKRSPRRR
jgi:hypothetical protein